RFTFWMFLDFCRVFPNISGIFIFYQTFRHPFLMDFQSSERFSEKKAEFKASPKSPFLIPQSRKSAKFCKNPPMETDALAPIGAEILLLFSLKSGRLQRIAGKQLLINIKIPMPKFQIPKTGGTSLRSACSWGFSLYIHTKK
ncbi:hypothetical protein, partial [Flavobacterium sp. F52]|uniref:hypothetical protein n=1 Tax=Flavobacterium sp. F52 TaxID=1202532 RepID=UPI000272E847